ncbi:MAG: WecB/TagA/CpsF family glycosyltransferase [Clostridia bacterium]|nr:WecB/TagA/CpsF family glycosyltransferase [Clostridia bacterium]
MSNKRLNVLGVGVDTCNMEEAANILVSAMEKDEPFSVFTPNSEIILYAYKNPDYLEILNRGSMITPDGIGVVHASKILKRPLPERVGGFDLANVVLKKIAGTGRKVYLFGGKPGVAEDAAKKICELYPGTEICGTADGYFDAEKEQQIISDIHDKKPDLLFVCLGFPKQETWIDAHKNELGAKVMMGIGGSLDVFAGTVKRAPVAFQKLGLEWLYRLLKQPSRFIRMLALPKFGFTVLLHGKKYLD